VSAIGTVSASSPPAFGWDAWYAAAGGRSINIDEVARYLQQIHDDQFPRFTGPIAAVVRPFASPDEAAAHLKARALQFGADLVGICNIEPSDIYQGRSIPETHAIAVGQAMRWREFQVVPSRESAVECLRVYFTLGEAVIQLAAYIRSIGYPCRVEHPIGDSDLLHIPIGLKAGFGELGRHGSIIHPRFGPLFRMGSVATSLPLAIDHPIDAGIARFCDNCRACRKFCPADAIPDERSPQAGKDHLGYDRYMVDTGRCFPYFATHSYCSICLPVCAYNHKEWARDFDGFATKLFPTVLMPPMPAPVDPQAVPVHWYPKRLRS
jgi:epoxyqueuosine reductase